MSLLGSIQAALERTPELTIVGIDYRFVGNRFNTIVFRIAPSTPLEQSELEAYFDQLQFMAPDHQHPKRKFDFLDRPEPYKYGELIYEEKIGTEEMIRTFTVDDAVNHRGRIFEAGRHEPEVRDIVRAIELKLYPTEKRANRAKYGLTVFELGRESLHDLARALGVLACGERTGS